MWFLLHSQKCLYHSFLIFPYGCRAPTCWFNKLQFTQQQEPYNIYTGIYDIQLYIYANVLLDFCVVLLKIIMMFEFLPKLYGVSLVSDFKMQSNKYVCDMCILAAYLHDKTYCIEFKRCTIQYPLIWFLNLLFWIRW